MIVVCFEFVLVITLAGWSALAGVVVVTSPWPTTFDEPMGKVTCKISLEVTPAFLAALANNSVSSCADHLRAPSIACRIELNKNVGRLLRLRIRGYRACGHLVI